MLGYVPFPTIGETPYALTLAPYSFLWLELQPASVKPEALSGPQLAAAGETSDSEGVELDLLTKGWSGLLAGHGLAFLESALPAWLPRQRWFGAKAHKIQSARVLGWAELPTAAAARNSTSTAAAGNSTSAAGLPAASTIPPALFFIEIAYADGPRDIYQLPLAFSAGADAEDLIFNHPQSILATLRSPIDPAVLHDATVREDFRQGLLSLIGQNASLELSTTDAAAPEVAATPTTDAFGAPSPQIATGLPSAPTPREGQLDARASAAFAGAHAPLPLSSSVGSAEQSNTSILYGKSLILKLFRRLQPGENPDVEIGRFLTEVAHFPRIPPFLGEITITSAKGEKTTIAMLQGLVANQGDGWQWFREQLAGFFTSVATLPAPSESHAPSFLSQQEPLREAVEYAGPSLVAAALLGRRTAELHLALATPTQDPAFAAEPFTPTDLARDARRIEAQITSTLEALKVKFSTLKGLIADEAGLLLSRRLELFARAHAITASAPAGQRIRIHGDYHLGQTLRTGSPSTEPGAEPGDFILLDFEGEPARPLSERCQKQSPLKDIAGMIRSLSYAAHAGLDQYLTANPEFARDSGYDRLAAWAILWQNSASAEFLRAYRETIAVNPALLPSPQGSQTLLGAYLLEKALYELLYELNNRPAWLRIPLAGILTL
jgi:maltose alpha-D-glucosyltransferase/alpha-amylase